MNNTLFGRFAEMHRPSYVLMEERRCAERRKNNSASETKADASAERAVGGGKTPPSFLPQTSIPSDGKKLFFEFLSRYLGVTVFGIQPGYKNTPDTYLFKGPHGTSMNVPTSVMLLDQAAALRLIEERISEKKKAFENGAA